MKEHINEDDLLIIISSRKDSVSYHPSFEHIPEIIDRYYSNVSLIMIYPDQFDEGRSPLTMFNSRVTQEHYGYETQKGWFARMVQRFKTKK